MKVVRTIVIWVIVIVCIVFCVRLVNGLLNTYQHDEAFSNLTENDLSVTEIYSDAKVKNIMLFGVDAESGGASRSDAMMILSLDYDNGVIKLISLMRDSYLSIPGYGMDKLTHAFAYGGPELAVQTVNENFGLDITDYMAVNFSEMAAIIDAVGGVTVDVSEAEMNEVNKYIGEYGRTYGVEVRLIESPGTQLLDGVQAMTYGRIRKNGTGDDWGRVERQSIVLRAIFDRVQEASLREKYKILQEMLPNVTTSLSKKDILVIFKDMLLSGISMDMEHVRFPGDEELEGEKIGGVYYITFDIDAVSEELYRYIYAYEAP